MLLLDKGAVRRTRLFKGLQLGSQSRDATDCADRNKEVIRTKQLQSQLLAQKAMQQQAN